MKLFFGRTLQCQSVETVFMGFFFFCFKVLTGTSLFSELNYDCKWIKSIPWK